MTGLEKLKIRRRFGENVSVENDMIPCLNSVDSYLTAKIEPAHDKIYQKGMCAQRRLRSALASAQSDQSLRCPHKDSLGP